MQKLDDWDFGTLSTFGMKECEHLTAQNIPYFGTLSTFGMKESIKAPTGTFARFWYSLNFWYEGI